MERYVGLQFDELLTKVASYCAFSKGKELVLNTQPSFQRLMISQRCAQSQEALQCVFRYGTMGFDGIRDIEQMLSMAGRDGTCSAYDFLHVLDHERGLQSIQNYMSKVEENIPILRELVGLLIQNPKLVSQIESCITPYGDVKDSASPLLMSIRKRLSTIDADLNKEAQRFISKHASQLMDTVVTQRNNRIVVMAKISEKNALGGIVHAESASGQTAYVEPTCLLHLNNEAQSLISAQIEEVERILYELSQALKEHAHSYTTNMETLALLDSIFAKARYGKDVNGIVANLSDQKQLYFKLARHPFIDAKEVVANTYTMKDPIHLLMISGPNTGGKSVSLKIIGLFVLMTYCGIPVLAEEASVPYFDDVFMDLTDDQSIEQSLSTFSAHVSKLAHITRCATSRSLVLLDEIGSGTDPKEGESLAIAVLNFLRRKHCMSVVTTHYGRLKAYGKKHDDILLASVQFDMELMRPTFKFIEGLSGSSNAFSIAKRFNLSEEIVKEAIHLRSQVKSSEDELIEQLERQVQAQLEVNQALDLKLKEANEYAEKLKSEYAAVELKKAKLIEAAQLEAKQLVEDIQLQASIYMDELKQVQDVKLHTYNEFKAKTSGLIMDDNQPLPEEVEFKVGMSVSLTSSNQVGKILSIQQDKVVVDINGMKITTKKNKLVARKQVETKKRTTSKNIVHTKPRVTMECHLIGMRVEEALVAFEKYMDDALLSNLNQVRIIHGVGTGALRTAIHERLKRRKGVEYRLGGQGEGGVGATVVTFVTKK